MDNKQEKNTNKQVIILRGISGSGKSTFIENFFPGAVICSADHFFLDNQGNYNFDHTKLGQAHSQCQYKFSRALDEGVSQVVVDNTNTKTSEMRPYINMANEHDGYDILIIRLDVEPDVAIKRNVHGVPAEVIQNMYDRMQPLPSHWVQETVIKN
jgi:predicted kinase